MTPIRKPGLYINERIALIRVGRPTVGYQFPAHVVVFVPRLPVNLFKVWDWVNTSVLCRMPPGQVHTVELELEDRQTFS